MNYLEKWFWQYTRWNFKYLNIFEPNNDSLEFFSDLKLNSFGARADVNGTKERYHVHIFTIAFAFCLCRWCIISITSTSYTHAVLLWWTKQSDLFVKWWMMNRHHPRTLDSFKAARGKNNTQHLYYFLLPPDLMTAIFDEENILRRHIHTPRNFCSREEEELQARKRLGACCLSGHLSFNCDTRWNFKYLNIWTE